MKLELQRIAGAALLFVAAFVEPSTRAAPALTAGNVTALIETTVPVPITLAGGAGVSAVQFDATFDAGIFASAGAAAGGALAGHLIVTKLAAPDRLRVIVYSPTNGPIANGIVIHLPFIIASAAPTGSSSIELSNVIFSDNRGARITGSSGNGSITVSPGEPPKLEALMLALNGDVSFMLTGVPGQSYILQRSSDLVNWSPFSTNVVLTGSLQVQDLRPNVPYRFYRAAEGQ